MADKRAVQVNLLIAMLSKTFDDIGSDAVGAYMFQRTTVIVAKKDSDFLKEPFNLVWIFWQPLEKCILSCLDRKNRSGQSVPEHALRRLSNATVQRFRQIEHEHSSEPRIAIDDAELQLAVGCRLFHHVRGEGTLVAQEAEDQDVDASSGGGYKPWRVRFDVGEEVHCYNSSQVPTPSPCSRTYTFTHAWTRMAHMMEYCHNCHQIRFKFKLILGQNDDNCDDAFIKRNPQTRFEIHAGSRSMLV